MSAPDMAPVSTQTQAAAAAITARMVSYVKEQAWIGEWGDLLADNPVLRTFDALADIHWFELWRAAGYDEVPRDRSLLAAVEQQVNAALAALPADDLRPVPDAQEAYLNRVWGR
jgi:hypothetical protein